jgi:hypothetical protein
MIAALFIALSIAAQPDPASRELAAKSFAEGEAAFAKRQFSTAALAFERAARLVSHPSTWLNAAEAWEKGGDFVHAAEDCDRVLEIVDVPAEFAEEATRRLERLEPLIARLEVRGRAERRVKIDGGETRRPPFSKRLSAGKHRLEVDDEQRIVELAPGESRSIELDPPAEVVQATETPTSAPQLILEPPPPKTEEEDGIHPPPTASWIAFGAAAAALGGGLTFGGLTLAAQNDYEAAPSLELADRFFDRRRTANLLLGATVVAVAIGVGLWILDEPAL